MIYGIGIDLVHIKRIEKAYKRWGEKFLKRVFTLQEQSYCLQYINPAVHLAGIFAAKEAVLKALGTGLSQDINWPEVQIKSVAGKRPSVLLSGAAKRIADGLGIKNILISLSHDTDYAIAQALALN